MNYINSYSQYKKDIVPILNDFVKYQSNGTFYDVFCGGANICDGIVADKIYASDISPTLIGLHKQAQKDFTLIPTSINKEMWDEAYERYKVLLRRRSLRNDFGIYQSYAEMPLATIGAIEWYGSFAHGGFWKGYNAPRQDRDYYKESYDAHKKQASSDIYKSIEFYIRDFQNVYPEQDAVIYCDPPRRNGLYQFAPKFNKAQLISWAVVTSAHNPVLISEEDIKHPMFVPIWIKGDKKLYYIDNRPYKFDYSKKL